MKQKFILVFTSVLILLTGCCEKKECSITKNQFDYLKIQHQTPIQLDFSLSDSIFIQTIEQQTQKDICEQNQFVGILKNETCRYQLPIIILKYCDYGYIDDTSIVLFLLNKKNQIMVDTTLVHNSQKIIVDQIYNRCKEYHQIHQKKHLAFQITHDSGSKTLEIEKALISLYLGIDKYFNSLAQKKYYKSIQNCRPEEVKEITSSFHVIVTLNKMYNSPPPPPLLLEGISTELEVSEEIILN